MNAVEKKKLNSFEVYFGDIFGNKFNSLLITIFFKSKSDFLKPHGLKKIRFDSTVESK